MEPHPLFKAFIGASYEHRRRRLAPLVQDAAPLYAEPQEVAAPQETPVPQEVAAPREEPQYSGAD